jgi:Domain of unknown function (DUF4157)
MLQAPVSDKETKPEASRSEGERESERFMGWGQPNPVAATQQAVGNQAALRMMRGQQQRSPAANPVKGMILQRKCVSCGQHSTIEGMCEGCRKKRLPLQRRAANGSEVEEVPPIINEVLSSPGQPLDLETRTLMESLFKHDFSQVQVHTDARAAKSAKAIDALAYTLQNNIVFGERQYAPQTNEGKHLLAHELVHVVQQSNDVRSFSSEISSSTDSSEQEAEVVATQIMKGLPATISTTNGLSPLIQRQETWFRGEATGVAPASPGGVIHDFGDGLYLTNDPNVATQYAELRASAQPSTGRVLSATFERNLLGRVLDLTQDVRWQRFVQTRMPSGVTYEQLIRMANENYWRFFQQFLQENNLLLESFDTIIGPEYVRGGTQVCVRNPSIAAQIRALLRPGLPGVPPRGGNAPPEEPPPSTTGQRSPGSTAAQSLESTSPQTGSGSPVEAPPTEFRVNTQFRVLNTSPQTGGNTVAEVEVLLSEGLEQLNRTARVNGASTVPSRLVLRITISPEGALVAAESTTGEAAALAETLARQAMATIPRAASGAEAATGAAAGAARAVSPWVRGIGWAGLVIFVGVTAYQYRQAEAQGTPGGGSRVLATAGGGFAGGFLTGYLVCNVIFGIETVGWSLLGCLFVAGIPGSVAGSSIAGDIYDATTATPIQRALHELESQPANVRRLFYAMVERSSSRGGLPITEGFVRDFIMSVPGNLADDELATLTSQMTAIGAGATLEGVLTALRRAINQLPRRRPILLHPVLNITDVPSGNPYRIDALGSGRIRLLPPERIPRPIDEAQPPRAAPTRTILEIEL